MGVAFNHTASHLTLGTSSSLSPFSTRLSAVNSLMMEEEPQIWRHYTHFARSTSPLLYAHLDQKSTNVKAEAPLHIGWQALLPAVVFTILASVAVMFRWYSRLCLTQTVKLEDWLILFAIMLSIAMTAVVGGEVQVASRMAGHMWEEEAGNVSKLALLVLCSNLLYQILINATKTSFLLQYLRLFHQSWAQRLCKVLLIVVLGAALYGFFGGILMCDPVRRYWDPLVPGKCRDAEIYWLVTSSIGIIIDFIIWLLPMPLLRRLRLPPRQKIGVLAVFAVGGFICIVSVLRLSLVQRLSQEGKAEDGGISAITWSTIEANVGIICASLMASKPLLVKIFPCLLGPAGPSRGNMRLPTISESPVGPTVWLQNWNWGSRNDVMCSASRPTSWIPAPEEAHGILVTKKSVVEANWRRDDSVACGQLMKPSRAYSRESEA